MKVLLILLTLFLVSPKAEARAYAAEELEGLLAPVALQPDAVVWLVLDASMTPHHVAEAASWSRANPHLLGDAAVAAAETQFWPAPVKALVAYPDLLARMAESPQWLTDLGSAYIGQRDDVLAAVQALRQRAHANGHLDSDPTRVVQHHDHVIAVLPAVPYYYSVRYYNPVVVYGATWRPRHSHIHWRPWVARPIVVHRPVHIVHKPLHAHPSVHVHKPSAGHPRGHAERSHGGPSPAARMQREQATRYREYHRVPESKRQPIVQSRPFEQRQFGAASHPHRHR